MLVSEGFNTIVNFILLDPGVHSTLRGSQNNIQQKNSDKQAYSWENKSFYPS